MGKGEKLWKEGSIPQPATSHQGSDSEAEIKCKDINLNFIFHLSTGVNRFLIELLDESTDP